MFIAYAVIAGISYADCMDMQPGLILDIFLLKRKYDSSLRALSIRL